MAFQEPKTIKKVVTALNRGYFLPSFQREFVWERKKIEELFDSLMRDFPINSFLFWKIKNNVSSDNNFYEFVCEFEKNKSHNPKKTGTSSGNFWAVLDGQQRLTALNIGLYGHYIERKKGQHKDQEDNFPKYRLYLNLEKIPSSNEKSEDKHYQFEFKDVGQNGKDIEKNWFPVYEIADLKNENNAVEYAKKHCEIKNNKMLSCVKKLFKIIHEKPLINFYLEDTDSIEKALKIFIRVNKGGTTLDYSDLLLSCVISEWNDKDQSIRKDILEFVDKINLEGRRRGEPFRFNKDFVLKTSLVLTKNHPRFNVESFKRENVEKIKSEWNEIKKSISSAVAVLVNLGFDGKSLTSNNAVIPIAHYFLLAGNHDINKYPKKIKNIQKYITRALINKVFGGSSDTTLETIRNEVEKSKGKDFPFEGLTAIKGSGKLKFQFTASDIDNLLETQYKDNLLYVLLMILQKHNFPPNGTIHKDHFFPQKYFKNEVKGNEDKNKLANLVLLVGNLNQQKSSKPPYDWINEQWEEKEDEKKKWMKDCYIPPDSQKMRVFSEFYKKRKERLKKELKQILEVK